MKTYEDIQVGDKEWVQKIVTEQDVVDFARISTDNNPVHLDEEYAKNTLFKKRIAHGMFSAGLISAAIGTKLPGYGTIYLSQDLKFRAPVFLEDELTAFVEVIEKIESKKRLRLRTWVVNQLNNIVTEGEALVLFNQ